VGLSSSASTNASAATGSVVGIGNVSSYFNPITGQPLRPADAPLRDADLDTSGETRIQQAVIDEYVDLTLHEKDFMKLWIAHIAASSSPSSPFSCSTGLGDRLLFVVCEQFVRQWGEEVAVRGLRHNLLLHWMTLWDFGLLLSEEIEALMNLADSLALIHYRQSATNASADIV
jgi:hypothetical protein